MVGGSPWTASHRSVPQHETAKIITGEGLLCLSPEQLAIIAEIRIGGIFPTSIIINFHCLCVSATKLDFNRV